MRLGTCIALEIVTGLVAVGAASLGTAWAFGELRPERPPGPVATTAPLPAPAMPAAPAAVPVTPGASDGLALAPRATAPVAEPVPTVAAPDTGAAPAAPAWSFGGRPDDELLAPLRTATLRALKLNRGGTSLSLRLDFDNGAQAAFKPEQIHPQSNPRREIAAYRIDRLLGVGRVPPAFGRTFTMAELLEALGPGQPLARERLRTEIVAQRGRVHGELSWWIPVLGDAFIGRDRIDSTNAIVQWRRWLKAGAQIPAEHRALCEQLSTMTLFDFVIDNTDRWTGNNAKASEDGTTLFFIDNTLSFTRSPRGHHKSRIYLERVQTFSRRLVARLRALEEREVREVLARDVEPFERLLSESEIKAILGRRDAALEYIDGLISTHGEDPVLVFP